MSILSIINELGADSSRLAKEAILKRELNNETFKKVLLAAYDPTISYYIKKIPPYKTSLGLADSESLEWALEQLHKFSSREISGNAASDFLKKILMSLEADDAAVILLIIKRDLKCGINVSTINKVWPELIPEIPYMRCSGFKDLPKDIDWAGGIISQVKADGSFVNFNYNHDGSVEMYTRGGSRYDTGSLNFGRIIAMVCRSVPKGFQIHGELLVEEIGTGVLPREVGNGILNSVLQGGDFELNQRPIMEVWDIIPIEYALKPGQKYKDETYAQRVKKLFTYFIGVEEVRPIETKVVYSLREAMEHYQDCLSRGLEGTIIKLPKAIWTDSTSREQFKVKVEFEVELRIKGFTSGNGKNEATFGSVTMESEDGLLEVNVSGFTDKLRKEIHENRDKYMGGIATVRANAIMKPSKEGSKYSLFLPRWVEFRHDKQEADTLARIQEQYDSIVKM
jgi:DNA ligase-1